MSRFLLAALVVALLLVGRGAIGQSISADQTITRISAYVEQYFARAQSVITNEEVSVEQIKRDLTVDGFARRLVYELRVEWDPSVTGDESPAKVTRQLLTVNGKPPREGDEPECLDPPSVSPAPLTFLLPDQRHKFTFTSAGLGRIDRRDVVMVDFRSLEKDEPMAEGTEECIKLTGVRRVRGRVWADPETAAIVRLDERLVSMVDFPVPRKLQGFGNALYMTLERSETSIRYRPVMFTDPEETLMLPAEIVTTWLWRNTGSVGSRITQSFSNYRRFVTGGRIVR